MTNVQIKIARKTDVKPLFPEIGDAHKAEAILTHAGILEHCTREGRTSVYLSAQMSDGSYIGVQVTGRVLEMIVQIMKGAEERWLKEGEGN